MFKAIQYKFNQEVVVMDAKTTVKELSYEVFINFLYGFLGNVTTVFVILNKPYLMAGGFFFYYSFLSIIINRDKYETKLGKYFIMPISAMLGAMTGCLLAFKFLTHS